MMAASLSIGELVGPYRIIGELGGGGMGMVYRAVHSLLHRPAAIKVLRPELGGHSMAIDRFLTEARATTAIRHPGIVEVYDFGHTPSGSAYIAMELLEGQTLGRRLAERGPLTLLEALTITRRIAAPLAAAHDRGIVHRDLKPDNVFLVRDHEGGTIDQIKILDFGIAKLESTAASHRTTLGLVLGTPAYMSPEQCRGAADCDHRSDLYSLGCMLFEMLTGHTPFQSATTSDLFVAHIHEPPPELGRLVTVPPEIARLVRRLLAKSPDERPRNALEVIADIDQWFASRGFALPAKRGSLRLAIIAASGIAISLTALGAWYRWWRSGAPPAAHDAVDASTQARTIDLGRPPLAVGTRHEPDAGVFDAMLEAPVDTQAPTMVLAPPAAPAKAPTKTGITPSPSKGSRNADSSPPSEKEVTSKLGRHPVIGVETFVQDVASPVKP